jgi:hypothetical protein
MKQLTAHFVNKIDLYTPLEAAAECIDTFERHAIDATPWPAFQYKPNVTFSMGYCNHYLLIKYYVTEEHVRAQYIEANDPVYKDSCVEFFIAFNDDEAYYNFEFNCTGTCRAGFGSDNISRELLPGKVIRRIRRHAVLRPSNDEVNGIQWELTVLIPFGVFSYHGLTSLKGTSSRVNFYKCGDDLPKPHFLAWSNIVSATPDFHRPEYFGRIEFAHP